MVDPLRILINEDVPSEAELLEYEIRKAGIDFVSRRVDAGRAFVDALREFEPDLVISDYSLPVFTGMEALKLVKIHDPLLPFIVVTGAQNEEIAVGCMKAGADDYVLKDHPARIGAAIRAALDKKGALLEKQRAEERLAGSERKFRAIFENANDAMFLLEGDVFVECNAMAERLFGVGREALVGRTPADFSPEVQPGGGISHEIVEETNRAVLAGSSRSFEWRHRGVDGTPFDVDVRLSPVEIGGKNLVLSVVRDITGRKAMEQVLREGEEKYRRMSHEFNALLDAIPDALLLLSREQEVVWANRSALNCMSESDSGPGERRCYRLLHRASEPHEGCPVCESFRTGLPAKNIVSIPGERTWEVRSVPVKDENGVVENVIELGRDITEIRKLEQQLFHAQKMEAVGQLAGGVAHDFNNIVTALIGYANLLLMRLEEGDPSRHFVEQMLTTAERAAELTQGLLAFSRKKVFKLDAVDFNDVVKGFRPFLERIIGDDVEVKAELECDDLIVMADSGQMEQVMMNLAANARDAMPEGGVLTIRTNRCRIDADFIKAYGYGEEGAFLLIEMADTGIGMDSETQRKIFEPFFTTKEQGKGTGLGLSIAYGIVKEHGGYINVSSNPGMGSTFRIYLPLVEKLSNRLEISAFTMPEEGNEAIILAEDDETVLEMESKLLETYGYRVIKAVNGDEALAKFMSSGDDVRLLILDIMMPGKGGLQVAADAARVRPDVKVLFNSGYPLDLLQKKGILSGDVPFFTKPIGPRELLRKVREILDAETRQDGPVGLTVPGPPGRCL